MHVLPRPPAAWRLIATLGLLGVLLAPGLHAQVVTGCPPIRPAGLTPAQVDAVVLGRLAQALRRPPADLDTRLSLQAVAPPGEAAGLYGFIALAIGEALGFDAATHYRQAAGSTPPHEALSLSTMQALAREAYASGSDAPPPLAVPGSFYRLDGVRAAAPTIGTGWYLMRCGHDQLAWWRRGAADDESITAVLRITALPPWTGPEAFAQHLREALLATVPAGYRLRSLQVQPQAGTDRPCADAHLVARAEHLPWRLRARFCHAGPPARHGHAVLFSHAGSDDVTRFEQEADDFLAQVRTD